MAVDFRQRLPTHVARRQRQEAAWKNLAQVGDEDETLALALTRLLEIVGEAANGVSPSLRETHPHIAWKEIIGVRHHLIHGYFEVDYDIVWQILTSDLPPLIADLEKLTGK